MAHHLSALKRIRQIKVSRLRNRYQAKTMRNAVRSFREITSKSEASEKLPGVVAIIDKLAQKDVIHKNKAGNLKSSLMKQVNGLK